MTICSVPSLRIEKGNELRLQKSKFRLDQRDFQTKVYITLQAWWHFLLWPHLGHRQVLPIWDEFYIAHLGSVLESYQALKICNVTWIELTVFCLKALVWMKILMSWVELCVDAIDPPLLGMNFSWFTKMWAHSLTPFFLLPKYHRMLFLQ